MQFTALSIGKIIVSGAVGIGTGKIVGKIIKNNVTPETLIDRVTVGAAAWVIAGIATERTKKYTNDVIDEGYEAVAEVVKEFKLAAKLKRINSFVSTFEQEGLDPANFMRDDNDKWVPIKTDDETKVAG